MHEHNLAANSLYFVSIFTTGYYNLPNIVSVADTILKLELYQTYDTEIVKYYTKLNIKLLLPDPTHIKWLK